MSFRRTSEHANALVEKALHRAGKSPKVIITDKLFAYLDGIEMAFGADTQHIQSKGFSVQPNTNLIERFHGTLKSRTKVMRGFKTPESALLILDGWLVFYNFFRPHESLNNKTPAEKAGLKAPFSNWMDIVKQSKPQRRTIVYPLRHTLNMGQPSRFGRKRKIRKYKPARKNVAPMASLLSVRMSKQQ